MGVITNAPTYDWRMTNVANCVNLSPIDPAPQKLGEDTFRELSMGSGLHGLPGDFTSPSQDYGVRLVDLMKLDLDAKEIKTIKMDGVQSAGDVTETTK